VQGFLKAAGLASLDQAHRQRRQEGRVLRRRHREARPGDHRGDRRDRAGRDPRFPWPKSMRWGEASRRPAVVAERQGQRLRWVRPLHSILCTFGAETEDPEVVPFEVDGIVAGDTSPTATASMRRARSRSSASTIMSPSWSKAKVVLDADRRKEIILADAKNLAFAAGPRAGRG
jgi:glycyl-tRNA synthetase beta chain